MQRFQCRECLHNGTVMNRVSKGNMKSHLGMVHGMGPWGCSVCAYASVRSEYVQAHIDKARRSGPQAGRHAQAVPFRSGAMSLALQHESDLCQLPHTVVWPNQAAAALVAPPHAAPLIVAPPPIAPAIFGPSAATGNTIVSSDDDSDGFDDEHEEMDQDVDPASPASKHTVLVSTIADIIRRTTVIGRYYTDRIDELSIPEGTHEVVGIDGRLIGVSPAGMRRNAAMILYHAIEELELAEAGLKAGGLQEDQLESLAMRACEAMSQMSVALTWYQTQKGNTEDDMGRLSMMHSAIVDNFDVVKDDEGENEMQGKGGNC